MTMCVHPMILSDLTPKQVFESNTGILHASSSGDPTFTVQYCITTRSILLTFTKDRHEAGYDVLSFSLLSSEVAWTRIHPEQAILNKISVRLCKTNLPTLLSKTSYMSTSPASSTPHAHSSRSGPNNGTDRYDATVTPEKRDNDPATQFSLAS